jgi:hypothetical protein
MFWFWQEWGPGDRFSRQPGIFTYLRLDVLLHDRTTLYCIISNMKIIVQFHIFRPKFKHQNNLFVHRLRTTTVKLNSVSQKQFLVSTVVLMTGIALSIFSCETKVKFYDC